MDQAKTPNGAAPLAATAPTKGLSGPRDGFVYLTAGLVALALGLALKLHLELATEVVAGIALPTTFALVLVHQFYRRGQVIAQLKAELAGLRRGPTGHQAMNRGGRELPGGAPNRLAMGGTPGPGAAGTTAAGRGQAMPHATAGLGPVQPGQMQTGQMQTGQMQPGQMQTGQMQAGPVQPGGLPPQLSQPQSQPQSLAAAPVLAQAPSPSLSEPIVFRRDPASAAPEPALPAALAKGPPPIPTSTAAPMLAGAIVGQSAAASVPASDPGHRTAEALPGGRVGGPTHTEPATGLPAGPIAAQITGALMGTYWGHRPGDRHAPSQPAIETHQVATSVASVPELQRFPANAAPGAQTVLAPMLVRPPVDPGPGPDERELETMQNLIQQLAVQLNAPKAATGTEPSSPAAPAEATSESVLSQSLAALRATATTMRQAPATQSGLPSPGPQDGDGRAGAVARDTTPAEAPESQFVPAPVAPAPTPVPGTAEPASRYGELARVAEAVAADRIEVYLDPILALSDRKARLFEVSVRLRSSDGDVLDPAVIEDIAAGTGLLARIDAAKLARSARVAGRLKSRGTTASLYTNVASESLSDDVFLDTFEEVVAAAGDLPKRLVLAFAQAEVRAFNDVHWETVLTMSEMGLRFALEEVADLDMDFERLKSSGFEYVKLDAQVFLEGMPAADGDVTAADLCRHLASHGLALIVGRIEDELSLAKILGFGVLFGQGAIFGGARAVQVEAAQPPQVAAA